MCQGNATVHDQSHRGQRTCFNIVWWYEHRYNKTHIPVSGNVYNCLFYVYFKNFFLNTFIWLTGSVAVAFLYYKSIGPLFSPSDNLLEPQSYDKAEEEGRVISSVISLSISSNPPTLYELEKVTFTLNHIKVSWNSSDYWLLLWNIQRNEFLFVVVSL